MFGSLGVWVQTGSGQAQGLKVLSAQSSNLNLKGFFVSEMFLKSSQSRSNVGSASPHGPLNPQGMDKS